MKINNKIISYFVAPPKTPGGTPRVFQSPVTMNSSVAKTLITQQLSKETRLKGELLHVCFDADSDIIYVPNASSFNKDQMRPLLQAAQISITNDFGGFAARPPVEGSPFSSIRVRAISSFSYAAKVIKQHHKGKVFTDLPVIEAYLARMPSTLKSLPEAFRDTSFYGGYISPSHVGSITFLDEMDLDGKKREKPTVLLTQKTPFILINISKETEISAYEKEWVVLAGYRDYLYDAQTVAENEKYVGDDIAGFADLYAIKRYLYLGWPLEEVTNFMLTQGVTNFNSLMGAMHRIMMAVQSLIKEGYKDPSHHPYYTSFQIDPNDFPMPMSDIIDMQTGQISKASQLEFFRVIDFDLKTSNIIVESRLLLSPDICKGILRAKSNPIITTYNPVSRTIDVKSDQGSIKSMDKRQVAKLNAIYNYTVKQETNPPEKLDFRFGDSARGEWSVNTEIFHSRKISDYFYAYDFIVKMCEKSKVPFADLDVVIGPIETLFGRGVKGGFYGKKAWAKTKMPTPYEIVKGIWISPPVIFIDSRDFASYAKQTEVLIHEYRHYIFGEENPTHEKQYEHGGNEKGEAELKKWYNYFTDPNERAAFKAQIRYGLLLGKSVDEVIRDQVQGAVTMRNYPMALKFREMVMEVVKEIEAEDEEPAVEEESQ